MSHTISSRKSLLWAATKPYLYAPQQSNISHTLSLEMSIEKNFVKKL